MSCAAPIVPTKMLGDAEELDRHLVQHGYSKVAKYDSLDNIQLINTDVNFFELFRVV